ncbi:MAG: DUF418 domain-containing protein [Proteobacteria bacterium]|nr:DUF418 domain-containing protein [Pseudomonadota bacterium]
MKSSHHADTAVSAETSPTRFRAVDALRGFALLGIIIVNAPFFVSPTALAPAGESPLDFVAFWFTNAFFTGKFFLIFSFLFGFGFAAMLRRSSERSVELGQRFARRLLGLFLFGLLHAALLFFGDILMLYAVLGVILWTTRNWPVRRLLIAATVTYVVAILCQASILELALLEPLPAASQGSGYLGGFWDGVGQRIAEWPMTLSFIFVFNGPAALAMFWLGLALGRLGLFPPDASLRRRLKTVAMSALVLAGLGSGAVTATAVLIPSAPQTADATVWLAAAAFAALAPIFSFGLSITILDLAERRRETWVVRGLAETGSASLTGYLLHSVILSAVVSGWGLGYYGALGPAACLAVALATFVLVATLINLWKLRFRFGPDEWLLRSLVELRWQPLSRPVRTDPV